ncbi:hypothetical protein R5R35_004587 [Gryllus longicercus]|uniref:Dynein heavy chain n=1 Tax=Gryllus longicercus TaxID=2509291 RepID=A0AAN9ZG67_9ORTH
MIQMAEGQMARDSLMFFLTGGVGLENTLANPAPDWLPDKSWDEACRLNDLPVFKGFREHLQAQLGAWEAFAEGTEPHLTPLPAPWGARLSSFERMLVLRVMRPDKLVSSVRLFVEEQMGPRYVKPPAFDIEKSYDDSDSLCPLIFILSPGADPMAALLKFSERMGVSSQFSSISLGQGQGPIAERMVKTAQEEGGWVCLQNCHLAVSWLPRLEFLWENFDPRRTHRNFRLWLTSYPSDKFPTSILQFGVKMTNEPPTGLQQNIMRSYLSEPLREPEFYSGCPNNPVEYARLLYGLCFFHAVVQERRKYGAIGWNIPYGFNESDLQISLQQLQMFISESDGVPYPAIQYMCGECNYGGRVTDDWDRRSLTTILLVFINPKVGSDASYLFCDEEGARFGLPPRIKYSDVINFIEALPAEPPPAAYGLHMNAGVIRALGEANSFCDTMLLVVGEGGGGGGDTAAMLSDICTGILNKLPPNFNIEEANKKYPVVYEESMNTVLVQEMQRFNKLLTVIRSSLELLGKALVGMVVMTPDLDAVATALGVGKVPGMWAKASYPSLKPLGGYISDFLERMNVFTTWYNKGKPTTFWLSGFYFTQAFLTGAMQNFARKHMLAINTLTYDFEVLRMEATAKVSHPPMDGVYVFGCFLDGARWDRGT